MGHKIDFGTPIWLIYDPGPIWDTDLEPQFLRLKKVNVEATLHYGKMILISYHLKNNDIHFIVYLFFGHDFDMI
jgi:hypothetical protein